MGIFCQIPAVSAGTQPIGTNVPKWESPGAYVDT